MDVESDSKSVSIREGSPVATVSRGAGRPKSTGEARKRKARTVWKDDDEEKEEQPFKTAHICREESAGAAAEASSDRSVPAAAAAPAPAAAPAAAADVMDPVTFKRPYGLTVDVDEQMCIPTETLFESMLAEENRKRVYDPSSPWLRYRRVLVDWMSEAGEHFGLNTSTVHVGILLMDRVLQTTIVPRHRLQLVAMCSLLVAGKYEEAEQNVPTADELNKYAKYPYTRDLINECEIQVLMRLGWKISEVVPLHYLGYFMAKGIVLEDDTVDGKKLVEKVPRYVAKYTHFFSELGMQDYAFQQYTSSVTAAAIVAASRRALKIEPLWRPELTAVTRCTFEKCRDCYERLWNYFVVSFPQAAAQYNDGSPGNVAQV